MPSSLIIIHQRHLTTTSMDGEVILKQRARSQRSASATPPGSISFRHPGYDDPEDILFALPRLDCPQSGVAAAAAVGVHHGTALLACQIIANNAFDGYLTTDRAGACRVSVPRDGVLLDDDYWFIVGGDDAGAGACYPVVPRFEEWQFPHGHLGSSPAWDPRSCQTADQIADASDYPTMPTPAPLAPPPAPTSRCILSDNPYATQRAHIIPTAQTNWFLINSMKRYGDNQQFIHTNKNYVPIRHDLHKLWDDHVFVLVPKHSQGGRDFVVHVLNIPRPPLLEFASDWHNRPVQEGALDSTSGAFLFAKFAQAVFMLFKPFIAFPAVPRYIATCQARADDPRFPIETKIECLSASALNQRYGGGGSRSASASVDSRKRSRSQASAQDEDKDDWYRRNVRARLHSSESVREEEEARWYAANISGRTPESVEEEEHGWYTHNVGRDCSEEGDERGRPRRRRQQQWGRSEHTVDTLPSLTDTSVADDLEELDQSSFPTTGVSPGISGYARKDTGVDGDMPFVGQFG
ncbi:hypothetical protein FJTKL_12438 [Diaporthe vaccinii]|uniref:HNH nuclease domain-containing protein n=1 Tax=Diaporthe vaccinii TaxID=105482 RepID=A0ABR4EDY8_9PEZI